MEENFGKDVQINDELKEQNKSKALLGFRTDKAWKKIISVVYLVFCVAFAVFTIFEGRKGQITLFDYLINKISGVVLTLALFSPYILLSNTKLRDKLPLFKKHSAGASTCGMMIVLLVLFVVFGGVDFAHSSEYKADMADHAYVEVSSKAATCENDGEIQYRCEYCGKDSVETVAKLGHDMVEVTRIEATENEGGQIVNKCSSCGKEETVTLDLSLANDNVTEETEVIADNTTVLIETQPAEQTTELKWLPAIGNLYSGVELYIVTEDESFLYGEITEYDTIGHRAQVYLVEGENFMWFPTREVSFLHKLKVRSDDPRLPENQINN